MSHTYTFTEIFPVPGFPLKVQRRVRHTGNVLLHRHEFVELVIVESGEGVHLTGTHEWPLAAGDVFVITGTREHGYRSTAGLEIVNVLFVPDRIGLRPQDLADLPGYHALFTLEPAYRERDSFTARLRLRPALLGTVQDLVQQLDRELKACSPGYRAVSRSLLIQIMAVLSRAYETQESSPATSALLRLAAAISHIESCYAERTTLDQLAHITSVSRRQFQRLFREVTGRSPIDYLLNVRLERAAHLLRSGCHSVTEAAASTGFEDSNYFGRQFRRKFGTSPKRYSQ